MANGLSLEALCCRMRGRCSRGFWSRRDSSGRLGVLENINMVVVKLLLGPFYTNEFCVNMLP